jgi:prepilin-type N-terminal cleavage/methylation domain-containing protein
MRTRHRNEGFSLIEVLFAIAILGFGVMGLLSVFSAGISAAAWANSLTSAAVEAQTLAARVSSEVDAGGARIFLNRMQGPMSLGGPDNEWIHTAGNLKEPVLIDPDPASPNDPSKASSDLWWQCRVTGWVMDEKSPLDATKDDKTRVYQRGLYQIAIAVYRNWKPSSNAKPVAVYTTLVMAGS